MTTLSNCCHRKDRKKVIIGTNGKTRENAIVGPRLLDVASTIRYPLSAKQTKGKRDMQRNQREMEICGSKARLKCGPTRDFKIWLCGR